MAAVMVSKQELGRRLRVLRAWHGWTLEEVQDATGIAQSVLSRWERGAGKRYPDLEEHRLPRLAEHYDVTVAQLLDPDSDTRVRVKAAA